LIVNGRVVRFGGNPAVDIDHIVYLINFVFGGSPSTHAPCFDWLK
jgi:hypothetical protein